MTWLDLKELLLEAFEVLEFEAKLSGKQSVQSFLVTPKLMRDERSSAGRVDELIAQFVYDGKWRSMSQKEYFFVKQRLRFAYSFVIDSEGARLSPYAIMPRVEGEPFSTSALRWVLTALWHQFGLGQWVSIFSKRRAPGSNVPSLGSDHTSFSA